jgi:hypothetical protein
MIRFNRTYMSRRSCFPRRLLAESNDWFFRVGHGIDNPFNQTDAIQTAALPGMTAVEDVPVGALITTAFL